MSTTTQAHVPPTPPDLTDHERALACWEDDGGPTAPPPRRQQRHWLRIGAALSRRLPHIAGRDDILVTCQMGTRSGAPAAFYPTRALLEIDAALFAPLDLATINPAQPGDEARYPVAWGVFTHEAAHAAHSRWTTPPPVRGTAQAAAAALLEESRAEHAHLTRRPADRAHLRAAVHSLILSDITKETPTDTWRAAHAAGLILARRDAGILDPDETEHVHTALTAVLGSDVLQHLTGIWTAAHTTGDEDGQAMLQHAEAWCHALGADPAAGEPAPDPTARRGELAGTVVKVAARIAANDAAQAAAHARAAAARTHSQQAKAAQADHARQAAHIAKKVFAPGAHPYTPDATGGDPDPTPIIGTRPPTQAEKRAAAHLARALRAAAYRERTTTHIPSQTPPGRLTMRQALARDAQAAAGAIPTATPWTRTVHRPTPTPPLRVGIAVDVSASMSAATEPIASAAWILARAVALTDPDSRSATVAYHRSLTAITTPGRTPHHVTRFHANGLGHSLAEAIDALTTGLDLTQPGAGRLLVIASDGHYAPHETTRAADRITALRATGCAALWLAFKPDPAPLPGATVLHLTNPAKAHTAIAQAATHAVATHHDTPRPGGTAPRRG